MLLGRFIHDPTRANVLRLLRFLLLTPADATLLTRVDPRLTPSGTFCRQLSSVVQSWRILNRCKSRTELTKDTKTPKQGSDQGNAGGVLRPVLTLLRAHCELRARTIGAGLGTNTRLRIRFTGQDFNPSLVLPSLTELSRWKDMNEQLSKLQPTRFSIMSLLLVTTIVALAIGWKTSSQRQGKELAKLRKQHDKILTENGYLNVIDETKVYGRNTTGASPLTHRWRVYLPPGQHWQLKAFSGLIPGQKHHVVTATNGMNGDLVNTLTIHPTPNHGSLIEIGLFKQKQGWVLVVHTDHQLRTFPTGRNMLLLSRQVQAVS